MVYLRLLLTLISVNRIFNMIRPCDCMGNVSCTDHRHVTVLSRWCGYRGDVGSWLRGAAMGSLARVLPVLARWLPPDRVARAVQSAVGAVLKQAVERISTVRKVIAEFSLSD